MGCLGGGLQQRANDTFIADLSNFYTQSPLCSLQ